MTLVLRSLPAKTIPRTLPVTLNTANDHIKAIFAKAGIGSRGDLMATVFRDHACQSRSRRPGKVTAPGARPGPSRSHPVIRERPDPHDPPAQRRQNGRI
jgi:hypothetical protein